MDSMTISDNEIRRGLETVLEDLIILAKRYPVLIHTLRYALGAVYGLHRAITLGHKDRALYDVSSDSTLFGDLENISMAIRGNGTFPAIWEAGFFYNASVARTDAVSERFLLILLNAAYDNPNLEKPIKPKADNKGKTKLDKLAIELKTHLELKQNIDTVPLNAVREENNHLKHWILGQLVKDAQVRKKGDIETVLEGLNHIVSIFREPWSTALLDNYFKRHKSKLES